MGHPWFEELESRGQPEVATTADAAMEATEPTPGAISPAVVKNLRQISLVTTRKAAEMMCTPVGTQSKDTVTTRHSLEQEARMMTQAVRNEEDDRAMPPPPLLRGPSLESEIDDLVAW